MQKRAFSNVYQFLEKGEVPRFQVIEPEGTDADVFERFSEDGFASAAAARAAGSAEIDMLPCGLPQRRFYGDVVGRVHVVGPYGPAVFLFRRGL